MPRKLSRRQWCGDDAVLRASYNDQETNEVASAPRSCTDLIRGCRSNSRPATAHGPSVSRRRLRAAAQILIEQNGHGMDGAAQGRAMTRRRMSAKRKKSARRSGAAMRALSLANCRAVKNGAKDDFDVSYSGAARNWRHCEARKREAIQMQVLDCFASLASGAETLPSSQWTRSKHRHVARVQKLAREKRAPWRACDRTCAAPISSRCRAGARICVAPCAVPKGS